MRDYLALGKSRIAVMVAATAAAAYLLSGAPVSAKLVWTALATALTALACGGFNQILERRQDALMRRTKQRPLPAQRLGVPHAALFSALAASSGLLILGLKSGPLPCALAALTMAVYLGLYTPLKKTTPLTAWIGAAAGASSPLIGWSAAQGRLSGFAWMLFAIQFLWQMNHFLALFWLYRDDYARAGFKVIPAQDPDGRIISARLAIHSFSLLPASLLPFYGGLAGWRYAAAALALGSGYLALGLKTSWSLREIDARRLFLASLAYLPILFSMLLFGGAS